MILGHLEITMNLIVANTLRGQLLNAQSRASRLAKEVKDETSKLKRQREDLRAARATERELSAALRDAGYPTNDLYHAYE